MYYKMTYKSPIGLLTVISDNDAIVGLWMEKQRYMDRKMIETAIEKDDVPVLLQAKGWLNRYFAGEKPDGRELSLQPRGEEFRQMVWNLLLDIPYGEVRSYGSVAKEVAFRMGMDKMSAQAVGGAVGHNPIGIIIPCHRVVGSDGSMTDYAGGLEKKVALLKFEGSYFKL